MPADWIPRSGLECLNGQKAYQPNVYNGLRGDMTLTGRSRHCSSFIAGDTFRKFVLLKSRGGDYMVVAQNVAWLRSHDDGQTKVGIIVSEAI